MRRSPALALVLVALAAGCGGGDDGGDDREAFVTQANANCKERQQAEVEGGGDVVVRRADDTEIAAQHKLEPPEDLGGDRRRYRQL